MDCIFLEGITLHGRHGAYEEETRTGQRFVIDLRCHVDFDRETSRDHLDDAVDYAAVYKLVEEIVTGEPVKLLETLAQRICERLFGAFPGIRRIQLKIAKPDAPIDLISGQVGIETDRIRP